MNIRNRIGERYGKLIVLERLELPDYFSKKDKKRDGLWKCKCDCGNIIQTYGDILRNRLKTGNGCEKCITFVRAIPIKRNFLGLEVGKLKVIKNIEPSLSKKNKNGKWLCRCECGNELVLYGSQLRAGHPTGCGCHMKEILRQKNAKKRLYGESTINAFYGSNVHSGNSSKNKIFLSREDWEKIVFLPCHYCGEIDVRTRSFSEKKILELTKEEIEKYKVRINGVDRIDSNLGYFLQNCVPCCKHCNYMKLDYTREEFLNHIEKIYNFNRNKVFKIDLENKEKIIQLDLN